ncbi:hypothetical protein AcV5_000412 [Taiwanofungus camphoratus]|nr:hypothetical protein AcV5_000412 [Antrodia cinnamomea]
MIEKDGSKWKRDKEDAADLNGMQRCAYGDSLPYAASRSPAGLATHGCDSEPARKSQPAAAMGSRGWREFCLDGTERRACTVRCAFHRLGACTDRPIVFTLFCNGKCSTVTMTARLSALPASDVLVLSAIERVN